jgi:hypothetical protein
MAGDDRLRTAAGQQPHSGLQKLTRVGAFPSELELGAIAGTVGLAGVRPTAARGKIAMMMSTWSEQVEDP